MPAVYHHVHTFLLVKRELAWKEKNEVEGNEKWLLCQDTLFLLRCFPRMKSHISWIGYKPTKVSRKKIGVHTCLVRLKDNYICINRQAWFICLINNFFVYISCASFYVYVHTIFSKVLILKNSCFLFSYLPTSS